MTDSAPQPWPDVTSPVARRVLKQLAAYLDCFTQEGLVDNLPEMERDERLRGISHLWRKLCDSSLAEKLATGPDYLPDITTAMPQPYALFLRWFRPAGLHAQVELLIRQLGWYLDPRRPAQVPWEARFFTNMAIVAAILALCSPLRQVLASGAALGPLALIKWLPLILVPLTLILLGVAIWDFVVPRRPTGSGFSPNTRNVTALFHYLRRAYADAADPPPEGGALSAGELDSTSLARSEMDAEKTGARRPS